RPRRALRFLGELAPGQLGRALRPRRGHHPHLTRADGARNAPGTASVEARPPAASANRRTPAPAPMAPERPPEQAPGLRGFAQDRCPMALIRRVTARAAIAPHVPMAVGPELAPGRCARVPHRRPLPCSAWMPDDVSRRGGGGAMAMAVVRRVTARAAIAP